MLSTSYLGYHFHRRGQTLLSKVGYVAGQPCGLGSKVEALGWEEMSLPNAKRRHIRNIDNGGVQVTDLQRSRFSFDKKRSPDLLTLFRFDYIDTLGSVLLSCIALFLDRFDTTR